VETALITVVALLILAIVGISVGVANDAVNFLNSAFGSKVAPFKVVLSIAALGIIAGVTFSSGMMEVARKGIFNPQFFYLDELLVILFAVMIQNILLLDLFNTFGLPTSTTVSVVFGLFGGAIAVSLIKIINADESVNMLFTYINSGKVLAIISAIFLSVFFAFVFGSFTQYISRLIFTFDFKDRLRRYGGIWGGFALTLITYFILVKGAKGASFISDETVFWIKTHTLDLVIYSWIFWTIILQLLMWIFKANVLKIVVLTGTFALAMAFAANDLVNFIGAPLAGLNAYQIATGMSDPMHTTMEALSQPIKANTWILLASGFVMVLTLFFSKKSRTVSKTEINLSRQEEGYERFFDSLPIARSIVRMVISSFELFKKIVPKSLQRKVAERFDTTKYRPEIKNKDEQPSYDLLRAAVNLVVASALISYGTSLKLPLSTTYVTFIVAMATALPDKAWGRESAVYRVSGVLTVIGGWFFTAIMATLFAMLIAVIVYYTGLIGVFGLILLSAYAIFRSTRVHKKREEESAEKEKQFISEEETPQATTQYVLKHIASFLEKTSSIFKDNYEGIYNSDLKLLKKARKRAKKLDDKTDMLINEVVIAISKSEDDELKSGHIYAKALGSLHEISSKLSYMTKKTFEYFDNNHHAFIEEQISELKQIENRFQNIIKSSFEIFNNYEFDSIKNIHKSASEFNDLIRKFDKNQLKRIKKSSANKRRSLLYLNILDDTQGISYNVIRISSAFKEFYELQNKNEAEKK